MFRSVFTRLLIPYILILLIVVLLQSALITQLFRRNFYEEAKDEIVDSARNLTGLASAFFIRSQAQERITLLGAIQAVQLKYDATIWVVSREGIRMQFGNPDTFGMDGQDMTETLTRAEFELYLSQVLEGKTLEMEGDFLRRFEKPMLTLAYPVYVEDEVHGALFVHTRISTMSALDAEYYWLTGLFFLCTTLLGAAFIFALATRFARPLRRMNEIAGEIARGNFGEKVRVESRDEIGQLAGSFNMMAENLKRHEQLQTSFVANVSHELRSPMTSMQGFAQGMLDGTIPPGDFPRYLTIIRDESVRLTKLIRELLDLAQIDSGQFPLNIQRFEVNELIRRVLARFVDRIEERGVELEVDFKPEQSYVLADADRIEQVIVNLLDNAIKFVDEGGRIRLWTFKSEDKVLVCVGNSGSVIPEEDLPYVFERFYKVDKSHSGRRGTGLGLSIVRRILEQHGQTITVNSKSGSTTFIFGLARSPDQTNK